MPRTQVTPIKLSTGSFSLTMHKSLFYNDSNDRGSAEMPESVQFLLTSGGAPITVPLTSWSSGRSIVYFCAVLYKAKLSSRVGTMRMNVKIPHKESIIFSPSWVG